MTATATPTASPSRAGDLLVSMRPQVFSCADEVPAAWDNLPGLPTWLRRRWLRAFAAAGAPACNYLLWRDADGEAEGVGLCQHLAVRAAKLGAGVRPDLVATVMGDTMYQLGQVLFAGPYGVHFREGVDAWPRLAGARETLRTSLGLDAGTWIVKDLLAGQPPSCWTRVAAEPDMQMPLDPTWRSEDDYLAALPSKYRRRARRARRLGEALSVELITPAISETIRPDVERLFAGVLARADHVPFVAPADFCLRLLAEAPDAVRVRVYRYGRRVVGFSSLLVDGPHALAHHAAVEPALNTSHQLYLNLLLDLLADAIAHRASRLALGRTATTIKSSLGARPVDYPSYARHDGCVRNRLVRGLSRRMYNPTAARTRIQEPFKASTGDRQA